MANIDNFAHYKSWSSADCVEWIIAIDSARFERYRELLTTSFEENNFNGESILDLDLTDLKEYGIINLDDRKAIYSQIIQLMATQKRRDSQIDIQIDTSQLKSLSDVEEDDELGKDYSTLLTDDQLENLNNEGFCKLVFDETENTFLMDLIKGYVKNNYEGPGTVIQEIMNAITYYHGIKFDATMYVQVRSGGQNPVDYLTTRVNLELSKLLIEFAEDEPIVEARQVPPETLSHVMTYLGHHKGKEPDPLPCPVRSIHMSQICSDRWDADWIDAFDKKTIFEVILAANYLDIKSLLHLGAAKIATLIKQLDQNEINRIIEEEERYRREQAEAQAVESGQQESVFGLTGNDDDENNDDQDDNNEDTKPNGPTINEAVGLDEDEDENDDKDEQANGDDVQKGNEEQ
eukprot:CAMPEP_0201570486 /NCGR_PEP_ID=MMETSP0190_2-20130828/12773_1 /ASSEMBLY_ACC=CAM_ASM_000263 /TAXON_ID=37353 /ORGANISM="Rosalina sp." /LENGTH=403 /DNA_ID=CAMNT_0047994073 /DNA_START=23 /DNA_END=1237 /DNA_ORIENTATION=-